MSKMGQELERRLDENKYEMYRVLNEIVNGSDFAFLPLYMKEAINNVLNKIHGGNQ